MPDKATPITELGVEEVMAHMSERGTLEWQLAVERTINAKLRADLVRAESALVDTGESE